MIIARLVSIRFRLSRWNSRMLPMVWISGVSFLWEAIDAGYRGHTSISNRELDGHSRFIIPRRSLRAWKIPLSSRVVSFEPLYFQPPIDRLPVSFPGTAHRPAPWVALSLF